MNGTLSNCLILDLSRLLPGPYCSMILADHGARVIAIEDRRYEKEAIPYLKSINRNKEHMTLNLKSEPGKEVFFKLAKKADVIIEGFRPGVTDRLGIGYEMVKAVNSRIIYCSITGYGQTGKLKNHAGHDVNFAGYSGILSLIGIKDGSPIIPGIQFGDMIGGLNAAIGILLALYARTITGTGQYIDISMTDCLFAMLPIPFGIYQMTGNIPQKSDWLLSHRYACYNVYQTKDGKYISVGALESRFWKTICEYFGATEYIPLQYDDTRREEIIAFFKQQFVQKTRDEWMEIFSKTDSCIGSILDLSETIESDWIKTREMTVDIPISENKETVIGIPVKLSQTPGSIRTPPYCFGGDTKKILAELGYSEQAIERLLRDS